MIILPIWYMLHVWLGQSKDLGSFKPILISKSEKAGFTNTGLASAYSDLYNTLCNPKSYNAEDGKLEHDKPAIARLLHSILVHILHWECGVHIKVSSLLEQTFAIVMTSPEGQVRLANFLTGECSHVQ
jgi:hypothetical protein